MTVYREVAATTKVQSPGFEPGPVGPKEGSQGEKCAAASRADDLDAVHLWP